MMAELQTLMTFTLPTDMAIIKTKLESENIVCHVKNELHVQVDNFASNAIGGIELQVFAEDYLRARLIAEQAGYVFEKDENEWINDLTKEIPVIKSLPQESKLLVLSAIILFIIIAFTVSYALFMAD